MKKIIERIREKTCPLDRFICNDSLLRYLRCAQVISRKKATDMKKGGGQGQAHTSWHHAGTLKGGWQLPKARRPFLTPGASAPRTWDRRFIFITIMAPRAPIAPTLPPSEGQYLIGGEVRGRIPRPFVITAYSPFWNRHAREDTPSSPTHSKVSAHSSTSAHDTLQQCQNTFYNWPPSNATHTLPPRCPPTGAHRAHRSPIPVRPLDPPLLTSSPTRLVSSSVSMPRSPPRGPLKCS